MRLIDVLLLLLIVTGCGDSYDNGYDDGYDGARKSIFYNIDSQYRAGYEDGGNDAYYYDLGYRDGQNDESPKHPGIPEYMEGYYAGK